MDLALHHVGQGAVHQALGREPCLALKARRDDTDAEVAGAAGGTRVARVRSALVDDLDVCGVKGIAELCVDSLGAAR